MSLRVDVQYACDGDGIPTRGEFTLWVDAAMRVLRRKRKEVGLPKGIELTVRVVDESEGAALNRHYRQRSGATNVLSFPFEASEGLALPLLGDIVICAPVVTREATEQGKAFRAHWAHMTVHGILHLLDYDHQHDDEACLMESIERMILAELGIPDPYAESGVS